MRTAVAAAVATASLVFATPAVAAEPILCPPPPAPVEDPRNDPLWLAQWNASSFCNAYANEHARLDVALADVARLQADVARLDAKVDKLRADKARLRAVISRLRDHGV